MTTCARCPYWLRGYRENTGKPGVTRWKTSTVLGGETVQITVGDCRINPPSLQMNEARVGAEFPASYEDDWCGQHPHRLPVGEQS